ncbi:peptide ABC transporter substrate-binding protein [Oceanivirga miroungae]|uniref:Family 5 extracellular solute-binding protein n=1 Tax=Oceanivirga miroungae TaxID=1130046 RepID=A0A6I8MF36_9FUSO|nr:peptide ABC transporter substrate-binding protein [Oceanivirga miroungae]VWL85676.1 family 5 extracellular solute-binding protein [Oceanivirga miroungae]
MKKFLTSAFLAVAILSCGGAKSSNEVKLTYNLGQEGKTLDQNLATSSSSTQIFGLTQEGLFKVGKDLTIQNGLVKDYSTSEDGKTWTFHLKDNIKWSNGDEITANDFKFSWLRVLNPETAAEYAYMLYYIDGAEAYNSGKTTADKVGIKVIDDKTIEVTLKADIKFFKAVLTHAIYLPSNEKFVKEKGDEYALEADTLISSGPYILKDWVHNSQMEFVKNPYYYNKDAIQVDKIVAKQIGDPNAALNAFNNEELDIVSIPAESYEKYKNDPRLVATTEATAWYSEFNVTHPLLKNKKIRQALHLAVDREELVSVVYKNLNRVADSFTPQGLGMDFGKVVPSFDPVKAKKLFTEGLVELGLNPNDKVEISMIAGDTPISKKHVEFIQEQLRKNLGVELNIELMQFKERLNRMNQKNFAIVSAGWGADFLDPINFLDLWVSGGGNNHTSFANKEYDALIKKATVSPSDKERYEALLAAEKMLADEMPVSTLFHRSTYRLINPKFKNVVLPAFGADIVFNYVTVDKDAK